MIETAKYEYLAFAVAMPVLWCCAIFLALVLLASIMIYLAHMAVQNVTMLWTAGLKRTSRVKC